MTSVDFSLPVRAAARVRRVPGGARWRLFDPARMHAGDVPSAGGPGLLFVDGHADFYQPEAEPAGEAASMDLALVTGRGPLIVTDLEGRRPLVRDADVVALARRDAEETEQHGSQRIEDTGIDLIDLGELRAAGVASAMRPGRWNVSQRPFSTGSGSISTPMHSTMRSCRRWITACRTGLNGRNWCRSCVRRCAQGGPLASMSPSSIRSSILDRAIAQALRASNLRWTDRRSKGRADRSETPWLKAGLALDAVQNAAAPSLEPTAGAVNTITSLSATPTAALRTLTGLDAPAEAAAPSGLSAGLSDAGRSDHRHPARPEADP